MTIASVVMGLGIGALGAILICGVIALNDVDKTSEGNSL